MQYKINKRTISSPSVTYQSDFNYKTRLTTTKVVQHHLEPQAPTRVPDVCVLEEHRCTNKKGGENTFK